MPLNGVFLKWPGGLIPKQADGGQAAQLSVKVQGHLLLLARARKTAI